MNQASSNGWDKASRWIFPILLICIGAWLAQYTFNEKLDMNGDNYNYYINATSLASGDGYCDLSKPAAPPTNNFPPGYPLIMTPLRMITNSFVAQKVQNECFLIIGILIAYLALLRLEMRRSYAFALAGVGYLCPRIFHFSTMMMSEASFFMISMLVLYCLIRLKDPSPTLPLKSRERIVGVLKDRWFWVLIVALLLSYHIRTQGLALVAAVFCYLFISRRWYTFLFGGILFVVGCLPWMIRNNIQGLGGSRYVDAMMTVNNWDHDSGTVTMGEFIERFFDTLEMLLFRAIPNSIAPFIEMDYRADITTAHYLIGAIMLCLIVFGFWKMKKVRWFALAYLAANLGIISMFSTPSENRYLTTLLPLLSTGLFLGLTAAIESIVPNRRRSSARYLYHPLVFASVLSFLFIHADLKMEEPSEKGNTIACNFSGFKELHEFNKQPLHPAFQAYYGMGRKMKEAVKKKQIPADAVVCSRKPNMFYLYSGMRGLTYKYTADSKELISHLVENNVDIVLIEQLGYAQTERFLIPALISHQELFAIIYEDSQWGHAALIFDRNKAKELGF